MKKVKIAISLHKELLDEIDRSVDGNIIRSRSQAMELALRNGIREKKIDTAVLMIAGKHHSFLLKQIKEKTLLDQHLEFFLRNKITKVIITTQHSIHTEKILALLDTYRTKYDLTIDLIERSADGNAKALFHVREKLRNDFVALSGDIYNNFDLRRMIEFHRQSSMLATMGLMTRQKVGNFGVAILEGDKIIDFREKSKLEVTSLVVNAGIYVLKPEIFELFDEKTISLEKDLFPKIARIKQLLGYFTYGEYVHVSEHSSA